MARPRSSKPSKACHIRAIEELSARVNPKPNARVDSNDAVAADGQSPLTIKDAEVYAADPADLTGQPQFTPVVDEDSNEAWYFVSKLQAKDKSGRKQRQTEIGQWRGENKFNVNNNSNIVIGERRLLTFYKWEGENKVKTAWRMTEYRLQGKGQSLALCKIFASPKMSGADAEEEVDAAVGEVEEEEEEEEEEEDAEEEEEEEEEEDAEEEEEVHAEEVTVSMVEKLEHRAANAARLAKDVMARAALMARPVKKKMPATSKAANAIWKKGPSSEVPEHLARKELAESADAAEKEAEEAMLAISAAVMATKATFAAASQEDVDAEDEVTVGAELASYVKEEEDEAFVEDEATVTTVVALAYAAQNAASVGREAMVIAAYAAMDAKETAFAWKTAVKPLMEGPDISASARKVAKRAVATAKSAAVAAWVALKAVEVMEKVVWAATKAEWEAIELESMGAGPEQKAYHDATVAEFDLGLARLVSKSTKATALRSRKQVNLPEGIEKGPGSNVSKSMVANKSLLCKTRGRDLNINAFRDDFILTEEDKQAIKFIKCSSGSNVVVTINDIVITVEYLKPNVNAGCLHSHVIDAYAYIANMETRDISVLTTTQSQKLSEECQPLDWGSESERSWLNNLGTRCASRWMVFVPVNVKNTHWYLLVLNFERKEIQILNSLASKPDFRDKSKETSLVENVQACIDSAVEARLLTLTESINIKQWKIRSYDNIPQQMDYVSCGVYIIRYMLEWNGFDMRVDFTKEQMAIFRQKICCRLLLSERNLKRRESYRTPLTSIMKIETSDGDDNDLGTKDNFDIKKSKHKRGQDAAMDEKATKKQKIDDVTSGRTQKQRNTQRSPSKRVKQTTDASKPECVSSFGNNRKDEPTYASPSAFRCTTKDNATIAYINKSPSEKNLVHIGDTVLTKRSMMENLMNKGAWLGNNVLDSAIYHMLGYNHIKNKQGGKTFIITTFISSMFKDEGVSQMSKHESEIQKQLVRRAHQFLQHDMLFLPINITDNHWYLAVVNARQCTIQVLDSTGPKVYREELTDTLIGLQTYFDIVKRDMGTEGHTWEDHMVTTWIWTEIIAPRQEDGSSCGLFMLKYMEYWTGTRLTHEFTQEDINDYRLKLSVILVNSQQNKIKDGPKYNRDEGKRITLIDITNSE
ncbi:hypothetical protein ACP4OV_026026 [Aristida adscensionis]